MVRTGRSSTSSSWKGPFTRDDETGGNFVAVISEATRRRFFGEASALNRSLELDGRTFRVVGVVANVPATRRAAEADIWAPHSSAKSQGFRTEAMSSFYSGGGFGALLLAESRGEFASIRREFSSRLEHAELPSQYQQVLGTPVTRVEQYALDMAFSNPRDGRPPTGQVTSVLLGMVGVFLLLPTTNLVNINLSRFRERTGEIGVRKAFGASSTHLVWQFILENTVLCLAGGIIALVAAAGLLAAIEARGLIPFAEFQLNFRLFGYALALAGFFGLLSGAYPAWRTSRLHPVQALRGGER